jgi:hypothetical protein
MDSALDDKTLASNMLAQAKRMEIEAKSMIAEAARMKKDAQRMHPGVVAGTAEAAPVAEAAPAKRRGRPSNATKAMAGDAVQ